MNFKPSIYNLLVMGVAFLIGVIAGMLGWTKLFNQMVTVCTIAIMITIPLVLFDILMYFMR